MSLVLSKDDVYWELYAMLEPVNQKKERVTCVGLAPSKRAYMQDPIGSRDHADFSIIDK